jgi:hypothetical protein
MVDGKLLSRTATLNAVEGLTVSNGYFEIGKISQQLFSEMCLRKLKRRS